MSKDSTYIYTCINPFFLKTLKKKLGNIPLQEHSFNFISSSKYPNLKASNQDAGGLTTVRMAQNFPGDVNTVDWLEEIPFPTNHGWMYNSL